MNLPLKHHPFPGECPYCLKPVGYIGRLLAWLLGTGFHGCNFSNVDRDAPAHDILYRLSYRKGQIIQQGWVWRQEDAHLLDEAIAEIQRLRAGRDALSALGGET